MSGSVWELELSYLLQLYSTATPPLSQRLLVVALIDRTMLVLARKIKYLFFFYLHLRLILVHKNSTKSRGIITTKEE